MRLPTLLLHALALTAAADAGAQTVSARAYAPEDLVGKSIVVVANLKPARLRGVESQGMLLAADLDGRPIVATFEEGVQPGTRVR